MILLDARYANRQRKSNVSGSRALKSKAYIALVSEICVPVLPIVLIVPHRNPRIH